MPTRDGTVQHLPSRLTRIVFTRHYDAPVEAVWAALTEPAQLERWWAHAEEFELAGGGRFVLNWLNTGDDGSQPVARGRISALRENRLIEFNTDVFGALRFTLKPADEGSDLTFTATMPLAVEQEARMLAGWHWRLDVLSDALAGTGVDWEHWPRHVWLEHHRRYTEKLNWSG